MRTLPVGHPLLRGPNRRQHRLRLEHHPRATAIGPVVHRAVHVVQCARAGLPSRHSTGRARSRAHHRRSSARRRTISGNSVTTSMLHYAVSVGQSTTTGQPRDQPCSGAAASPAPNAPARSLLHHHRRPARRFDEVPNDPELTPSRFAHLQPDQVGLVILPRLQRRKLAALHFNQRRPATEPRRRDPPIPSSRAMNPSPCLRALGQPLSTGAPARHAKPTRGNPAGDPGES